MKRTGKITAAILAAIISVSSMGVSAFADTASAAVQSESKEDSTMKTRLTTVKQRIDIPEDLTKFDYSNFKRNGAQYYRFTWSKENSDDWAETSVEISGKVIMSVQSYNSGTWEWQPGFAKLSDSKLKAAAKKYIKEINPTIYKNIEIDEDSFRISLYGNEAYLNFRRMNDGVPVQGQTGNITINKNTGELIRYNLNWVMGAGFSSTEKAISVADAQTAYRKEFPIELKYTAVYDWETKKFTPHLIYGQSTTGQIDAFTGKLSTYDDYDAYGVTTNEDYGDDDAYFEEEAALVMDAAGENPATGAANKSVSFSDEELKKLEDENKLIKAETEFKNLKKQNIFFIPEDADITYENSNYDERLGAYTRSVNFSANDVDYEDLSGGFDIPVIIDDKVPVTSENGNGGKVTIYGNFTYNAETGDVISFYCDSWDIGNDLTAEKAQKAADDYAKTLLSKNRSKFGDLEEDGVSTQYDEYDKNGQPVGEGRVLSRSYNAQRMVDGIASTAESVSMTIGNNEHITSYNLRFYDLEYPSADKIISAKQAYKKFFEQTDYSLRYRCAYRSKDKKVVTALVYAADDTLYIDAFSGKLTYANGEERMTAQETGEYTDLEGSKYKAYAEKLRSYDIVLMDENGRLNENNSITTFELFTLMSNCGISFDYDTRLTDTPVTRQDAAKYLVKGKYGSNISDIAELKDLFKLTFTDVDEASEYAGYIAIANAAGLITGNGDTFAPTAKLTRGEALKLMYDYLS